MYNLGLITAVVLPLVIAYLCYRKAAKMEKWRTGYISLDRMFRVPHPTYEALASFVDHELPIRERLTMEGHLAVCLLCQEVVAKTVRANSMLRLLLAGVPPWKIAHNTGKSRVIDEFFPAQKDK